MSRKSRRSRARLVQEQALVSGLRKQVKWAAERELSLQCKIARLDKELFEAKEQIRKMSLPDVIVARKFKQHGPRGEQLVFQVMVDRLLMKWEFGEAASRSMVSPRQYAEQIFFEIRAAMIEGMENVLLGREVRESVL